MSFDAAPQLLLNGLLAGSMYALVAVSFAVIFFTSGAFHFAHALAFVFGAYTIVVLDAHVPLVVATVAGMLVAGAFGVAAEAGVYRPLRRRGAATLQIFLAALGLLAAGEAILHIAFGPGAQRLEGVPTGALELGSTGLAKIDVIGAVVAWLTIGAVLAFLSRSRLGTAIRGVSSNRELAEIFGTNAQRVYLVVYFLGSALAGLAGGLIAMGDVATPFMGLELVLAAAIGVFVGGLGSYWGAVIGGIALGLAENVGGIFLPGYLEPITAFALLFIMLLVRPSGFLGRRVTLSGRGG